MRPIRYIIFTPETENTSLSATAQFEADGQKAVEILTTRNAEQSEIEYRGLYFHNLHQIIGLIKVPLEGNVDFKSCLQMFKQGEIDISSLNLDEKYILKSEYNLLALLYKTSPTQEGEFKYEKWDSPIGQVIIKAIIGGKEQEVSNLKVPLYFEKNVDFAAFANEWSNLLISEKPRMFFVQVLEDSTTYFFTVDGYMRLGLAKTLDPIEKANFDEIKSIQTPPKWSLAYDISTKVLYTYNGTGWIPLGGNNGMSI